MRNILLILITVNVFSFIKVSAQNVFIPDANFKAILLSRSNINTNGDNEISYSEAAGFSGTMYLANMNISDLTGIEAFTNIVDLACQDNKLTSLNITNNKYLNILSCENNQLTSLDVSNNTSLTFLTCNNNQLTSLDVSNNLNLTDLDCSHNLISTFDVSKNTQLSILDCNFMPQLTFLNVKNGNNANFNWMKTNNSPNLKCIQVDDVNYCNSNWTSSNYLKPPGAIWSENCLLGNEEFEIPTLNVYPNPIGDIFYIEIGEETQIRILNTIGECVINQKLYNGTNSIDVTNLITGIYFMQTSKGKVIKLIKK